MSLHDHVVAMIRERGPVPVAQVMALANAHYYATRDPLGSAGDFITAPEISQTFGEMIGLWLAEMWRAMGAPAKLALIEAGPGRGTLMSDLLRTARMVPEFAAALDIWLIETSPVLRERQRQALAGHPVRWAEKLDAIPPAPTLLVANEFVDALPIEQAVRAQGEWRHRRVGLAEDGSLVFTLGEAALGPADAPDGAVFETCPDGRRFVADLGRRLNANGGAALIIDYGPARFGVGETLQAVRRHSYHPILADVGEADWTAHVDFQSLAEAAAPARAWGPLPQGTFLTRMGIGVRAQHLTAGQSIETKHALEAGVHRLIDPAEMGTLFKVLALTHPALPAALAFD